jgi:predicted dehydrogenase
LLDGGLHLPYGASNSFGIEMWDFADAVLRGRRPEMDGEDGLRAQAPCMTCYESAASGKPVKYQDVPSGEVAAYQAPVDDHWKI